MSAARRFPRPGIRATTDAAIEVAGYVVRPSQGVRRRGPRMRSDRKPKLREFCRRFAERAFRRPLDDEAKGDSSSIASSRTAKTRRSAVKRVVLLVLKSPRFLYRETGQRARLTATTWRLGFLSDSGIHCRTKLFWMRPPPASSVTREQVVRQAERMVSDPRPLTKLREFFLQWLKVDQVPDIAKDPKQYPAIQRGGHLRPADVARTVSRRRYRQSSRPISASSSARTTFT